MGQSTPHRVKNKAASLRCAGQSNPEERRTKRRLHDARVRVPLETIINVICLRGEERSVS
jgi:hypothetical protein